MNRKLSGVTIIFNVTDLKRSERFYRTHFDLDLQHFAEEGGPEYYMARIGADIDVMLFHGNPSPGNSPNVVFGLAEGGIDTLVESLAEAGVEIVTPVSEAPDGWYADFRDPDGHIVSAYQLERLPRVSR
jgi:predicted enzyme related to lactoylglutathione lyase